MILFWWFNMSLCGILNFGVYFLGCCCLGGVWGLNFFCIFGFWGLKLWFWGRGCLVFIGCGWIFIGFLRKFLWKIGGGVIFFVLGSVFFLFWSLVIFIFERRGFGFFDRGFFRCFFFGLLWKGIGGWLCIFFLNWKFGFCCILWLFWCGLKCLIFLYCFFLYLFFFGFFLCIFGFFFWINFLWL